MIYLAQPTNGGPIRIGASENINARRRTLGTWLPGGIETVIEISGSFLGEAILHQCFNPIRVERDWFRSCDAIWEFILSARKVRPDWLSDHAGTPERIDPRDLCDEFGDLENAAIALGYSSEAFFRQTLNWQTSSGFGLLSKLIFFRMLRDGQLPSYISELHPKCRSPVERITGLSRHNLRPDVFGEPA